MCESNLKTISKGIRYDNKLLTWQLFSGKLLQENKEFNIYERWQLVTLWQRDNRN